MEDSIKSWERIPSLMFIIDGVIPLLYTCKREGKLMTTQKRTDYIKAISDLVATLSNARLIQLYEFALFLKSHPLPIEENPEEVLEDEAQWDAQFAGTGDVKLAELVESVEKEINAGKTFPMFNERGEFTERK
jgi:hypothetical protein